MSFVNVWLGVIEFDAVWLAVCDKEKVRDCDWVCDGDSDDDADCVPVNDGVCDFVIVIDCVWLGDNDRDFDWVCENEDDSGIVNVCDSVTGVTVCERDCVRDCVCEGDWL